MQMANITVKKHDGTTDVTYTAVVPSAGDKTPAIWKNQTVGTANAHRPEVRMSSRDNGTASARRVDVNMTYPTLVTSTDGKTSAADKVVITASVVVPKGMPDADVGEATTQLTNVFASALFKGSLETGYAPT